MVGREVIDSGNCIYLFNILTFHLVNLFYLLIILHNNRSQKLFIFLLGLLFLRLDDEETVMTAAPRTFRPVVSTGPGNLLMVAVICELFEEPLSWAAACSSRCCCCCC